MVDIVHVIKYCIYFVAATKDEPDGDGSECRGRQQNGGGRGKLPYNGYSEECLDRLEPNGNIPHDKEPHYGKYHLDIKPPIIFQSL